MPSFQEIKSQLEAAEKDLRDLDDKLGRAGPLPPRRDAPRDSAVGKRRISERDDGGNRWEGPPAKRFLDEGPRGRGRFENDVGRGAREPWGSGRRREMGNGGGRDVEDRLGGRAPGGRAERRDGGRGEAEREEGEFDDQGSERPSGSSTASGPARRISAGAGGVDTARNKRMFGALLGTLKTFQKDIQKDTQVEEKRKSIQQKIAERVQKENEDAAAQRKRLIEERKTKLEQLKKLRDEMAMARNHKQFVEHNRGHANFIQTKAEPFIFYLPAKLNDQTRVLLEETRKMINEKYPEVEGGDDLGKESDHEEKDVDDLPKKEGGDSAAAGEAMDEGKDGAEKEKDGEKSDSEIRVVLKTSGLDDEQEIEGQGTVKFKTDGLDSEEERGTGGEDDGGDLHED